MKLLEETKWLVQKKFMQLVNQVHYKQVPQNSGLEE